MSIEANDKALIPCYFPYKAVHMVHIGAEIGPSMI